MRMLSDAPAVNGTVKGSLMNTSSPDLGHTPLLAEFVAMHRELDAYRSGMAVKVDGHTLSIAAVTATARYRSRVELDGSPQNKERIIKSRAVIANKIENGTSVYGLSTGFGGSGEYSLRPCHSFESSHAHYLISKPILVPTNPCFLDMHSFNINMPEFSPQALNVLRSFLCRIP